MRMILPIILIGVFILVGLYLFNNQVVISPIPLEQGNVCDKDTMTCSDGTILRRVLPKCDFPPCPNPEVSGSSQIDNQITIKGEVICLPHKNTSGPQTLECAFGLKGSDGNNYGLSDPEWKYLIGIGTGKSVEVKGKLTKRDDSKYDTLGTIEIETLIKTQEMK